MVTENIAVAKTAVAQRDGDADNRTVLIFSLVLVPPDDVSVWIAALPAKLFSGLLQKSLD